MRLTSLISLLFIVLLVPGLPLHAQEADIYKALTLVRQGRRDDAEQELRRLEKRNAADPAVLYLHGVLSIDAEDAIGYYQRVVNENAGSAWADDALYRLYQYSYAVGAYRTARQYEERLRHDYPKSPFLSRKTPDVKDSDPNPESPAAKASPADSEASASVTYSIQVGAYSKRAEAERYQKELKDQHGYTLEVREKESSGRKVYAVWLGVFDDKESARTFMLKIKEKYKIDGLLVRR